MADISAKDVMTLRQQTGAGIMDCKKALAESDGSFDKAVEYLQVKKIAKAAKKAGRIAAEGTVASYIHMGGKIGVLCEVNCETDFAAKSDQFQGFLADVCMHIAALNPHVVSTDEISQTDIDAQKRIFVAQVIEEGKPEAIAEKIVVGKLNKWKNEGALLEQKFVKNPSVTIRQHMETTSGDIGEKLTIRRFVRFEMGEGLQKRQENFADEVAAAASGN
jgi:elongation factor Ts